MTSAQATAPRVAADSVGVSRTLALVAIGAVSIVLPFIFLPMEASWGHLAFHLLGIVVCATGVVLLARIRRVCGSRGLRVLTWIATATFIGWLLGHIGELSVVLAHGGAHADHDVFENPAHVFFATISVPSWMATVLSVLVVLSFIGMRALLSRRTR